MLYPLSCLRKLPVFVLAVVALAGCGQAVDAPVPSDPPASAEASPAPAEVKPAKDPEVAAPAVKPAAAPAGEKKHTNRLAKETSPYLLLHAHNPVDWYPWGEEALAKAKKEQKLIFLSIGYSACHWCHVMEREAFSDAEVAAFLNKHFVCIKVDREERPDVDSAYMTSLYVFNQLARTGRGGGWPLSMFLTPEAEPFFGGTYFPARDNDRPGQIGFLTLIERVQETWKEGAEKIREDAHTITQVTKEQLERRPVVALLEPNAAMLDEAQQYLADSYDAPYGGFGFSASDPDRPKFPEPSQLLFLLSRAERGNAAARHMLTGTLDHLARGGIRDHLGGGFHRYSVDRQWKIPHFEKMLYDNGQLATVFSGAYELTKKAEYAAIVRELCDFVLREMTAPEGAFYSALDADSEHEEGKFYRWEKKDLDELLTGGDGQLFRSIYSVYEEPNFEEKYYVLQWPEVDGLATIANKRSFAPGEVERAITPLKEKLFNVRAKRVRPMTDTKIMTSWNGYMIRGLADAGRALEEPKYTDAAKRAAEFNLENMRTSEGRLYRTFAQGAAKTEGYLDDYANFVDGLLALHRTTGEEKWLAAADELTRLQVKLFADDKHDGYFNTTPQHEVLFARMKDASDGVEPCGNSVTADNLLYLATHLKQPERRAECLKTIRATIGLARGNIAAVPRTARALTEFLASPLGEKMP